MLPASRGFGSLVVFLVKLNQLHILQSEGAYLYDERFLSFLINNHFEQIDNEHDISFHISNVYFAVL